MRLTKFVFLIVLGFPLGLGANTATADVVAVVSAKSTVATLSSMQATDIFLGKTSRFPDGSPAVAIDQPEGS
ncbi:MAG: phosphate ABC transporter substrate-binding protein, partial [Burkholderiales bacterium]